MAAVAERLTIWVVERGEYSDYRVLGVFSSKENLRSGVAWTLIAWAFRVWHPDDPMRAEVARRINVGGWPPLPRPLPPPPAPPAWRDTGSR